MLVGVASLPPSLIPSLRKKGILHHKKAKLPKHLQQSARLTKCTIEYLHIGRVNMKILFLTTLISNQIFHM